MRNRKNARRARRMLSVLILLCLIYGAILAKQGIIKWNHPLKYEATIVKYAKAYEMDPYMIAAIINVESKFNADAVSHRGAKGLMQLMDDTAVWAAAHAGIQNYKTEQIFDPDTNIQLGCWYLHRLQQQYDGDWRLTLAAYNGGSGNVRKWLDDPTLSPDGKTLSEIPFEETDAYLKKVMKQYQSYQELYSKSKDALTVE